jgi:hypothetical protein
MSTGTSMPSTGANRPNDSLTAFRRVCWEDFLLCECMVGNWEVGKILISSSGFAGNPPGARFIEASGGRDPS